MMIDDFSEVLLLLVMVVCVRGVMRISEVLTKAEDGSRARWPRKKVLRITEAYLRIRLYRQVRG